MQATKVLFAQKAAAATLPDRRVGIQPRQLRTGPQSICTKFERP
jgi:hypothetical protein